MPRHWYVAVVKPSHQEYAERVLRVEQFKVFNPRVRRKFPNKKTGGHFYRIGPYLPGYLFVQLDIVQDLWAKWFLESGRIRGIRGFIKNEIAPPGEPSEGRFMQRVRRGVVPAMMAELGDHFAVDERKMDEAVIRTGDRIRVTSGAWRNFEATALKSDGAKISFMLGLFGTQHSVELPRESLQLIGGER